MSWFLKSTIQLPFLCDIWKSHATDFGALFAHFQIYGYRNSLLKLCPLCTLLLVSYSLVLHVSMVMGAVLGHGAWTSAWRGSQTFPVSRFWGNATLPHSSHKSSHAKQVPNYNNCLHLGHGSNIRIRLIVLHYSTIWTGSWMFWLEAACWCSLKLLLSSFPHRSFPLCFQKRMKPLGNLYRFWFHIHCANSFWTRLIFPLQKLSF